MCFYDASKKLPKVEQSVGSRVRYAADGFKTAVYIRDSDTAEKHAAIVETYEIVPLVAVALGRLVAALVRLDYCCSIGSCCCAIIHDQSC